MEVSKFVSTQEKLITQLKKMSQELGVIKKMQAPLVDRWQMFLGLLIPLQLKVVEECGFAADQSGLTLYNEQLMVLSENNQELLKQNKDKWSYILKEAFGISEYKEITLEEAQNLISHISEAMISEDFLTQVDVFANSMHPSTPLPMKRKELLGVLFPLHMKVMSEHGFEGDQGYILAQRALMDYYFDPFIKEQASIAQKVLFERAKLT